MRRLEGKTVVILIAEGYYEPEYIYPYYRFLEENAKVITAGPKPGLVHGQGNNGRDGLLAQIDIGVESLADILPDILFLPGGLWSPNYLRCLPPVQSFIKKCVSEGTIVCSICHAPWILVSADVLRGKRLACPDDMSPDVIGAGAIYDKKVKVVRDGNLLSADGYPRFPEMFRILFDEWFPYK